MLWLLSVAVTAVLLAAVLAIQLPQVQTFVSGKVVDAIEDKIDGEVKFEKIHLKPFNALVIKNIAIIDKNPVIDNADTLFKAEYIIARFSLSGLLSDRGVRIGRAYVSNGYMNLVIEEDKMVNLTRIFRIPKPDRNKIKNTEPVFGIRRASVYNLKFHLINGREKQIKYHGYGMNWNDLEVSDINIEGRNLELIGTVMSGVLDYMSFTEKSGYICNSISGRTKVGLGQALIEELRLSDPWSEIYIPRFTMSYEHPWDFEDYIHLVTMDGLIDSPSVDMKTIAFFAPQLKEMNLKTKVSGQVHGPVDSLVFRDMKLLTTAGLELDFNGSIAGLPEIEKSLLHAKIDRLKANTSQLEATIKAFSPAFSADLGKYAPGSILNLSGQARGRLDKMALDLAATFGDGSLSTALDISGLIAKDEDIKLSGQLVTKDLDLGNILSSKLLGACSLRTGLKVELGQEPELVIDSLFIDRLHLNGYDYSRIAAAGTMMKHLFDGRIVSNDPNLNFMFQGVFSLSPRTRNSAYRFFANLGYADLQALNIDKRGLSKVSLQANANFNRRQAGDLLGTMEFSDILLENSEGKYDIGDIGINSYFSDEIYRMRMTSSFADASYAGTSQITGFFSDLVNITLKREIPALFRDTTSVSHKDRYRLAFRSKNSMDLLSFVAPGLYIADSTSLDISVDTAGVFTSTLKSPRIAWKENYIKDMGVHLDNMNSSLSGEITGKTINIATLSLENNRFRLYAKDNFMGFGYSYENPGELINSGEIFITDVVHRDPETDLVCHHIETPVSRVLLNSREWTIGHSKMNIKGKDINIEQADFTSGDQAIRLSGGWSDKREDILSLRLERFDISILNPLTKNKFGIEGAATGVANLISPEQENGLRMNFLVDGAKIAGADIGVLRINTDWDAINKQFRASVENEISGQKTLGLNGTYTPEGRFLDLEANLSEMNMTYAEPFLETIFSDFSGLISGDIRLSGPLDHLSISSENARITESELRVAYTNVPYHATGSFHIDDYGIHFDDITIRDRFDGSGRVSGGIKYDKLKNMEMDTHIRVSNMECLNVSENEAAQFYGNVSASGDLSVTGPLNSIVLNVNARTSGAGQLHIPIPSSATASTSNLLTFKQEDRYEYVDPYEEMILKLRSKRKTASNLGLKLNVDVTPEVEAFVEIDKASGNVLRGRGSGNIELNIDGSDFSILGDYTITSGNYKFDVQGLASRDFIIEDGSSVKFNGDILNSDLDINATYRTKASLGTLIADTTSVSTRRTVNCGLRLSDKLTNPRLSFSIDIPDLDPTVKSRVESALSTEDKVQKQFISLIVFGSFMPDDQSGVNNNASVLYSTMAEVMYGQLNKIFQRLDIPLDLSMNYQQNSRGQNVFDVAVSTQLFNNRVIVNGTLGNQQYTTSRTNSSVVGNLDIEIKLDKPGLFRLNLFSHSADQYTNYLDDSQRNGVGLAYQQEFNHIREFFYNMFTSKKKRREREAQSGPIEQPKKTIIIEADDK